VLTLGHPEGQAYALWHRSEALSALGRGAEARADAERALAIATRLGHRGWTATSWRALGIACEVEGRLDDALRAYTASLDASQHLGLFAAWAAARSALVLLAQGRVADAEPLVRRARAEGPPLGQFEARLAEVEFAVATRDSRVDELARAAVELADAAGVLQGRERLIAAAGR
jgi:tetratricopeptide (TPR) repeat protein